MFKQLRELRQGITLPPGGVGQVLENNHVRKKWCFKVLKAKEMHCKNDKTKELEAGFGCPYGIPSA
jgi:hypothetical protein